MNHIQQRLTAVRIFTITMIDILRAPNVGDMGVSVLKAGTKEIWTLKHPGLFLREKE